MPSELERHLRREKIERDDDTSYVGDQLIRQRLANEEIIKFAEKFIPVNSVVLDTCAGPEGSYLAATRRGYRWFGNDISRRFSEILARTGAHVTLSDFSIAPFRDSSADATLFILALNNICSPSLALAEAKRVTKPEGVIVEAEPGLSSWTGKIIFHSLISESPDLQIETPARYGKSGEEITRQFQDKPYTESEYVDLLLRNTLGQTRKAISDKLHLLLESGPKSKVFFRFQQYVVGQYFSHLDQVRESLGLEVKKAGILVMGLIGKEWVVPDPIEVQKEEWLEEVLRARRWIFEESDVVRQFPRSLDHVSKRIVMPVLCLKRANPSLS